MKGNILTNRSFLVLLTMAAGFVDAYTYLYGKAFPANMTGNTVAFAIAIGKGNRAGMLTPVFSIAGFIAGTLAGSLLIYKRVLAVDRDLMIHRIFILEAVVLALVALLILPGNCSPVVLVATTSVAMGLQGAAMAQIGIKGVSTITVTNTLTVAVNDLVFHEMALLRKQPAIQFGFTLQLLIWLIYATGAVLAALLVGTNTPCLLLMPAALVLAGAVVYKGV